MFIFLLKIEKFRNSKVVKMQASQIPSGGLEVPLSLTFLCKEKCIVDTMEEFIQNFDTFE